MKLSREQQQTWDLVSGDLSRLSHIWGQELKEISDAKRTRKLHNQVDKYISIALACDATPENLCRMVKTWLVTYQIPLNQQKMKTFNDWHARVQDYLFKHEDLIKTFDFG